MEKSEHIQHWIKSAEKDEQVLSLLFQNKEYVHTLFFAHLVLEKYGKAVWVKNNIENIPPKTHNILKLLEESNLIVENDLKIFILKLNLYQLEGRYPQHVETLYKNTTFELTNALLTETKNTKQWLIKILQ